MKIDQLTKEELLQTKADIKKVVRTPEGARTIKRLLDLAGVFQPVMTGNSQTFFLEGRRSIGLELLMLLDMNSYDGLLDAQTMHIIDSDYINMEDDFDEGD